MKRIKAAFIIWLLTAGLIYVLNGSKAAAAMFIVAAVYCVLALIWVFGSGRKLTVDISGERSVDKGKADRITVKSASASPIPVPACRFSIDCENVLTKEKQAIPLTYSYLPKGRNSGSFTLTGEYCGKERIKAADATISDPAGLFSRKQKIVAETAVFVMPEIRELVIPSEYLDSFDMESYTYSQHQKGTDTGEVFGIREYQDGDSPKQIHWKLSAKMDDLMVKIPSFPIENKLVVLLDNCISGKDDLDAGKRSRLMETFFSLSYSLLKRNIPHSLGWCDHDTGTFIIRKVDNDSDMWAAVPEALSAGIEQSRLSTVYRFLEESGEEHFTNHFIVTAGEAAETERLAEYGQVRIFRSQGN